MSPVDPGRLSELPNQVRQRAADFKADFGQWKADVGKDPSLLFRALPLRLALWAVLGLGVFFALRAVLGGLAPPPGQFETATRDATLYVACTNPACRASYRTTRPMDFHDWPLVCEKCGQKSVERATQCTRCRKWYAKGTAGGCPWCAIAASKPVERKTTTTKPLDRDDAEDGWD